MNEKRRKRLRADTTEEAYRDSLGREGFRLVAQDCRENGLPYESLVN